MKRALAVLALGALLFSVLVVFIKSGGPGAPERSVQQIDGSEWKGGDGAQRQRGPESGPGARGRVLTDEMGENLNGLDQLFSEEELAFRHPGMVARVTESLDDYRSDWMLGIAKLERALEELDPSMAHAVFGVIREALAPDQVEGSRVYRILFRTWGSVDGHSALTVAMAELPENAIRLEAGREAMQSWAREDPGAAAEEVAALPEGYGKDYLVYALPYTYVESDPAAALAWADGLPADLRRNTLLHSMIKWLDQDPDAARAYATDLAREPEAVDDSNGIIFSGVSESMARKDVAAAVRWVEQLPANSKARQQAILGLIDWWGITDPERASAWLGGLESSPVLDPAVDLFVRDVAQWDPAGAAGWARSITEPAMREKSVEAVLDSWAAQDASSARQWAESNGYRYLLSGK